MTTTKTLYCAFKESVLTFIICWFGDATEAQKNTVRKTVTAARLLGTMSPKVECSYRDRAMERENIVESPEAPLWPSGGQYCLHLFL